MSYDAGRQLLATVGQDHVIKVSECSLFLKTKPNTPTTADLEHEDRVGGLLNGGSLAEGHREEPGGGEGGGSQGQPGGSPYPHPRLLSQGCRPLQGQLSQVLMFCLNFAINPCFFR